MHHLHAQFFSGPGLQHVEVPAADGCGAFGRVTRPLRVRCIRTGDPSATGVFRFGGRAMLAPTVSSFLILFRSSHRTSKACPYVLLPSLLTPNSSLLSPRSSLLPPRSSLLPLPFSYSLFTILSPLSTFHFPLSTFHFQLSTVHFAPPPPVLLFPIHYSLFPIHYSLFPNPPHYQVNFPHSPAYTPPGVTACGGELCSKTQCG